jgi:hypothetical protein
MTTPSPPTATNSTTDTDLYKYFATTTSGGVANAISRTVVAPFERTRLQMAVDPTLYSSMINCMRHVVQKEGISGLWRGNVLNIVRIYPQGGISFLLKDTASLFYPKWFQESSYANPTSAILAGGISMSLVYPLDYVRVRMTVLPQGVYANWYQGLRTMHREGGIGALYEGLKYSNYWAMLYYGVQFTVYDKLKAIYLHFVHKNENNTQNPQLLSQSKPSQKPTMPPLMGLLLGSISGVICMTTAYPLEAIRRKLQVQGIAGRPVLYKGLLDCARQIVQQHGFKGLYIGLGANMTKTPLSIGVTFACYEFFMKEVFKTEMKKA